MHPQKKLMCSDLYAVHNIPERDESGRWMEWDDDTENYIPIRRESRGRCFQVALRDCDRVPLAKMIIIHYA
jgi:hypothetical protein